MNKINIFFCVLIFNVNINLFAFSRNQLSNLKENFEYQKAIDYCRENLTDNPSLNIDIGSLYYYLDDSKTAKPYLETALKISPDDLLANFYLARVYYDLAEFEKSIELLENCQKINPDFAGTYFYLGKIYQTLGKPQDAISNYQNSIRKDLFFVEARIPLAELNVENQNYKEAFRHANRIEQVNSRNQDAKKITQKVKPFLKEDEKKVTPETKLTSFKKFSVCPNRGNVPLVRVGINSDSNGNPNQLDRVGIISSGEFYFKEGDELLGEAKAEVLYFAMKNEDEIIVKDNDGNTILQNLKNLRLIPKDDEKNSFIVKELITGLNTHWSKMEDIQYRGSLDILNIENNLVLVNILNVEEYLYSVLPSEIFASWHAEAIKAQAVLSRNYILHKKRYLNTFKRFGYDICNTQKSQVYQGINAEFASMNRFVDMTRGKILKCGDKIVQGLYHSNSGGHTQSSGELDGWTEVEYLKGVCESKEEKEIENFEDWIKAKPDVFGNVPMMIYPATFRWIRIVDASFIEENLRKYGLEGRLKKIAILKRSKSGNVNGLKFIANNEIIIKREHLIRQVMGLGTLRSTMFWLEEKSVDGYPIEWTIFGGGWGHGVGMSQTGAFGMANRGYDYEQILKFYFQGTELVNEGY